MTIVGDIRMKTRISLTAIWYNTTLARYMKLAYNIGRILRFKNLTSGAQKHHRIESSLLGSLVADIYLKSLFIPRLITCIHPFQEITTSQ